jgi:hypothetical protein
LGERKRPSETEAAFIDHQTEVKPITKIHGVADYRNSNAARQSH